MPGCKAGLQMPSARKMASVNEVRWRHSLNQLNARPEYPFDIHFDIRFHRGIHYKEVYRESPDYMAIHHTDPIREARSIQGHMAKDQGILGNQDRTVLALSLELLPGRKIALWQHFSALLRNQIQAIASQYRSTSPVLFLCPPEE